MIFANAHTCSFSEMMSPTSLFLIVFIVAIDTVAAQPEPSFHKPVPSPIDRCNYEDPEFPFALDKLSGYRRSLTIAHGAIMVWVFIFFLPLSAFPVLWRRLAPNNVPEGRYEKQWILTHVKYAYPVYPLMTASIVCAMVVNYDAQKQVLNDSKCSFYNQFHELLGTACFMVYTFHFIIGFFSYESLVNDLYRSYRFYHGISIAFGYMLSIPSMAMARVASEDGANRYMYIIPFIFFFVCQFYIFVHMKFADFAALEYHMQTEAEIANDNKGIIFRTPQWLWNFGLPSRISEIHLTDLNPQTTQSRIRIQQYLDVYKHYWRRSQLVCFTTAVIMTVHLSLLYTGIFQSSAKNFPSHYILGDLCANWSLLEIYA